MNIRTTIGLCVLVIVVSAGYLLWAWSARPQVVENDNAAPSTPELPVVDAGPEPDETATAESRLLSQPPLTDDCNIVRVTYRLRNKDRMVFERVDKEEQAATAQWMMVEPTRCPAETWILNKLITATKRLKYQTRYEIGAAQSPTLEQAGFEPAPVARIGVSTDEDVSFEFEVGSALTGQDHVYVRLPDRPQEIFVVDGREIGGVIDKDVVTFKTKKLLDFNPADVVELDITQRADDGQMITYRLAAEDGKWRFTAPFQAKANDKLISDVVRSAKTVWAHDWLEEIPDNLSEFGLDQPFITVRLVTEQVPKSAESTDEHGSQDTATAEEPQAPTETIRAEHVLLLSDRSPLDDSERVYVKRLNEQQVGTINAKELDKFVPLLAQWRDMDVLAADIAGADRVKIINPYQTIELERRDDRWYFADTQQPAETSVVTDLLVSLDTLQAVSFVDDADPTELGLDPPTEQVVVTLPDSGTSETLDIGTYTENVEKRLRYVQRSGSTAVAKVKSSDVDAVSHDRLYYRNREILDYPPSRLVKLLITRRLPQRRQEQFITLERDENKVWQMTTPALAEVDLKVVNDLVSRVADLRGLSAIEETNPANLGLNQPDIQLVVTVEAVPTVTADGDQDTGAQLAPIVQQINIARHDDQFFAQHLGPQEFFEISKADYDALMGEFLDERVWSFEPSQVVQFSAAADGSQTGFEKKRDGWHFVLEPDIPIDTKKVETHLSQMASLRTSRYVDYNATNLAEFGLDAPSHRFYFQLEDGTSKELLVSAQSYNGDGQENYFAAVAGGSRVFLLPRSTVDRALIELARFESLQ